MTNQAKLVALISVSVIALTAIALLCLTDPPPRMPAHSPVPDRRRLALGDFSVLEKPTQRLPHPLEQQVRLNLPSEAAALDFSRAVRVGGDLWVLEKLTQTCILQAPGAALACAPRRRFARDGLFLGTFQAEKEGGPSHFAIVGVVPDRIRFAELDYGRRRAVVPVSDNLVQARGSTPILVRRLLPERG